MFYSLIARYYEALDRATTFDEINIIVAPETCFELLNQVMHVSIAKICQPLKIHKHILRQSASA